MHNQHYFGRRMKKKHHYECKVNSGSKDDRVDLRPSAGKEPVNWRFALA